MNLEARLKRLEQAGRQQKIRFLDVYESDPDQSEKILHAEQEAQVAGETLVVCRIVDGSTRAMIAGVA